MANEGVGLAIHRSWVKFPAVLLSDNNLGQSCSHTRASVTKQYNLVPVKER